MDDDKLCTLALLDRNDLDADEGRPVFVELVRDMQDNRTWGLLNVHVERLDEPDFGCPESGFTEESFLNDVELGYYVVPNLRKPSKPDDDDESDEEEEEGSEDDVLGDLRRVRIGEHTGTRCARAMARRTKCCRPTRC